MRGWLALLILASLLACGAGAAEDVLTPLPMDLSPGYAAAEEHYTADGYEDATLSVRMEKIETENAVYCVARVKIADPSQLRTYCLGKGGNMRVSKQAEKMNAVVAVGGEYFGSQEGGYIVRMGAVQQGRKRPYNSRDLLCIDERGDFHIILRKTDPARSGPGTPYNNAFTEQLKALTETHTLVNVFDFGPALVVDGEIQPIPANDHCNMHRANPRCAIGQTGPLEYLLVVVDTVTHHVRNNREGVVGEELAQFMLEQGCLQAYNLDGGNSAMMVFHGAAFSDKTVQEERIVSDIIYISTGVKPD